MAILLLILCPALFALGIYLGALAQMIEAREEDRPKLRYDNIYTRAMVNYHALLFVPDGEIVEAKWYSARRSAKELGGNPRDYGAGWIDHEGEAVSFKPIGLLPMPVMTQ